MLLENKNAVIYGAGGAIGGAVARAFARDGARVFLAPIRPERAPPMSSLSRSDLGRRHVVLTEEIIDA